MDREIKILEYLPSILHDVEEFQKIGSTEDSELIALWDCLNAALSDQFVQTATNNGVTRWESILQILPKGTDTLPDRKFRILTRLNEQLPYSDRMLRQQLAALCGENGYTMEINHGEYTLTVKVELTAKNNFVDVGRLLERVVPANLIIDLSLRYNQHSKIAQFTHGQLASYTHNQLRNEVIS